MERIISSKTHLPKLSLLSSRHGQRFPGANHLRCSPFPKQERSNLVLSSSSSSFPAASWCSARDSLDLVNEASSEKTHRSSQLGFCKDLSRQSLLKISSFIALSTLLNLAAPPANALTFSTALHSGKRLLGSEILSSAGAGFLAGCLHTLSGPDHLVALAPLSIGRTRTESALVGALWGFGHDAGQVIFGLIFLLLKERLHLEVIDTWGTVIVGLTLLVIGALGIKEASAGAAATPCLELNNHESSSTPAPPPDTEKKKVGFATFATGIVHGLQADALMMVLPALALPSRLAGASFLLMFLFGTVFAMASYTVFICSCSQALKERVPRVTEKLTWAASVLAIFMGLAIVLGQFFGFSLF
ncbi:High-affinity nickel-transport family protein [Rhynchospora pubera]|uniref:High-affinity nickel-transport family protein n=1 Tax=Rhynchospora pubera TaxID=906938 RepID=A0AAV8E6X4_9POAL|nr:High-affinity nickel-transport family protein [Rhynchospora pubera]